nr:LysR family transcriptional regulator [Paenibacillus hamazuiensis]
MEVVRCQSFTKAAEQLGYAQSSVTAQIQKLENEYGVVLFERYGRIMRLTSAGEELKKYVERILALHEESKQQIAKQSIGQLHIGTIESLLPFFLPPIISAFRENFPHILLNIHPSTEAGIIEAIKKGSHDVGLILDRPCRDDDLITVPIREERMVLVASPEHPLTRLERMSVADFNRQSLVASEPGCTYRDALEKLLTENNVSYELNYELGSIEGIKMMVRLGLGIALLPYIAVAKECQERNLAVLPFAHPDIRFQTQVIYHKKKWLSPSLRRLIELLQQNGPQEAEQDQIPPVPHKN